MGSRIFTKGFGSVLLSSILLSLARNGDAATVTTCDEPSLRVALDGGGTVLLACDGTITLTGTLYVTRDTVLDAQGHRVTISGENSVRVFRVSPSVQFTLKGLTVANGKSTNGAGIFNDHGSVELVRCEFSGNSAAGLDGAYSVVPIIGGPLPAYNFIVTPPTIASGGAIYNSGTLRAVETAFVHNVAIGARGAEYLAPLLPYGGRPGSAGSDGTGGAIFNEGTVEITRCTFSNNQANGGPGGFGGPGAPNPVPSGSPGGAGGDGGAGLGGAIATTGFLAVGESAFIGNHVTSGIGGSGGRGADSPGPGGAGGPGGRGGVGFGGAIFGTNGSVWITNTTLVQNTATGSSGGNGGEGGNCTTSPTMIPGSDGGNGGSGGDGLGGAFHVAIDGLLLNNTASDNTASGGAGSNGGVGGFGRGGRGRSGSSGLPGVGRGATLSGGIIQIRNTILAASGGTSNCAGAFTDGGHNICSDGSCNLTNPGSLNNTNPRLAPLANNGGPTLTMALLSDSPAIEGGDPAFFPPVDQRGVARPLGLVGDVGAYEGLPGFFSIRSISLVGPTGLRLSGIGVPSRPFRLESSDGFLNWEAVYSGTVSAGGSFLIDTSRPTNSPAWRFFRTAAP